MTVSPSIPLLPDLHAAVSPPEMLRRNLPIGNDGSFIRRWEGDVLDMEIAVAAPVELMCLHTDIPDERDSPEVWRDIGFEKIDDYHFRLHLRLLRPGAFQYRLRYRRPGDATWYLDNAGYGRLLVDPDWQRNLRMYSLVPTVSGHVGDWITLLPGIADLGFNVIHLLPLTAMDYSDSPYCARDLFALDAHYLDPADPRDGVAQFESFVDAALKYGIRLCVDLVLNHVGPNSLPAVRRPDWIAPDPEEADGFRRNGWHDGRYFHKWRDLCLLNYDHPDPASREALYDYMADYVCFWGGFAARTGGLVRLDNLHSSHEGLMVHVLDKLRARYPDIGILAELFTDPAGMSRLVWQYRLGMLLATPWEHRFLPQLRGYLDFIHAQSKTLHFHFPITSHDSGSPAEEFGNPDSTLPRYAVVALCGCGYTGLVQGVEYGVERKLEFIGRHERRELNGEKHDYRSFIRRINQLMDEYTHFRTGGNLRFVDHGHDAVLAALRTDPLGGLDRMLVLANFDTGREQHLALDCRQLIDSELPIRAVDLLDGHPLATLEGVWSLTLKACEVRVLHLAPVGVGMAADGSVAPGTARSRRSLR